MTAPLWETLRRFDAHRALAHVRALADPTLAGRAPGSAGERAAAAYLGRQLEALGAGLLEGLPRREPFAVEISRLLATPRLAVCDDARSDRPLTFLRDFSVNVQGAVAGGQARATTIWVGGPGEEAGVSDQLPGRIAVGWGVTGATGDDAEAALEAYLTRLRAVRDAGGLALLQVQPRADIVKAMNHRRERPGVPCLDVNTATARRLYSRFPPALGELGAPIELDVTLGHEAVESAGNVVAAVGDGPLRLLLCAHYDHLGTLPDGRVLPGAIDNASGVAVALELARVLAAGALLRGARVGLLFSAAEELGMVGAERFLDRAGDIITGGAAALILDEVAGARAAPMALLRGPGFALPAPSSVTESMIGARLQIAALPRCGFADFVPFLRRCAAPVGALICPGAGDQVLHSPEDRAQRVSPEGLGVAGRAALLVATSVVTRGER